MNKLENPINLLVTYRLNNFIKKFDIEIDKFSYDTLLNNRKAYWLQLKQKLILHKYVTTNSNFRSCFVVILNIIWKNIINYEVSQCFYCYHMIHSGYMHGKWFSDLPCLYVNTLLNENIKVPLKQNLDILQQTIINYLLLLDQIVTEHMLSDLLHITRIYMFDV